MGTVMRAYISEELLVVVLSGRLFVVEFLSECHRGCSCVHIEGRTPLCGALWSPNQPVTDEDHLIVPTQQMLTLNL